MRWRPAFGERAEMPTLELSWTEIFPDVDGSPVKENVAPFRALEDFYRELGNDAESVSDQFNRLIIGHSADFEGEAAAAFVELIGGVGDQLGHVPDKVREVSRILGAHGDELDEIRMQVDQALARARTRWQTLQDANATLSRQRIAKSNIDQQLSDLDTNDPEGTQRPTVEADASRIETEHRNAQTAVDNAEDNLAEVRREWNSCAIEYTDLDQATGYALKQVGLGELQDPGFWDKLGSAIAAFGHMFVDAIAAVWNGIGDLAVAMWNRDLGAALWALSDILGGALFIMGTILIFASGGTFAAVFAVLATAKFAIDAGLAATQTKNADGETMGWVDVGLAGLTAVTAGWGAFGANATNSAFALRMPFSGTTNTASSVRTGWQAAAATGSTGVRASAVNYASTVASQGPSVLIRSVPAVVDDTVSLVDDVIGYSRNTHQAFTYDFGPSSDDVNAGHVDGGTFSTVDAGDLVLPHLDCLTGEPTGGGTTMTAVLVNVEEDEDNA